VCLLEVAGEGVLCLGVRGGEAEPSLLVVAQGVQAQRRLDRAPPVPPEAAGRVEAVVPQQLPALVGDQGEFGDDPDRYQTTKGRKAFAGTAPVTRASGLRTVVVARAACNQRLVDACYLWAFAALTASPGARRCDDAHRARGQPITRRSALSGTGWSVSCTAAWPTGSPTRSRSPGPPPDTAAGGAGGEPPAMLANSGRPGPVVQMGQGCREVKRDGTAGLVG
jgi:hypothetical protein